MATLLRNIRYAIRVFGRSPGFALTVIATLALAIGANSAVFSAINAVLLKPLPHPEADRLVSVMQMREGSGETYIAAPRLEEWDQQNSSFEAITGYFTEDVSESTGDSPARTRWAGVGPNFLNVWRVAPALGRDFVAADSAQRPTVVMISDRLWRSRFAADPDVIGKTVRLGDPGFGFEIVGVLPASFLFPDRDVDVWFPNFTNHSQAQNRNSRMYTGVGRLRPGVTLEQAHADLEVIQARLADDYPDTDREVGVSLVPLKQRVVGGASGSLWLVFGAVTVLLLIACTNIAALLLSRAAEREHEIAVRYSLGASRAAIANRVLTEAVLLAFAGAVAGLAVAAGVTGALRMLAPELPRLDEVAVDARILTYTATSAVVVAMLCGLFPAIRSTRNADSLASAGRTQVSARHSTQWGLVGVQVALSVTLLAGAGLLLRSFDELSRVDPGFEPSRVLAFRVSGSNFEYVNSDVPERINKTLDELRALPGVAEAATTSRLPGVVGQSPSEFDLVEAPAEGEAVRTAEFRVVAPTYFAAMQIPLLAGDLCRETEADSEEVMVNRSFAERFAQGRSIIGMHVTGNTPDRIVGIVGDAREIGTNREPVPTAYHCISAFSATPWFLIRASGDPLAMTGLVRELIREIEPQRSVYEMAPLEAQIGDAYAQDWLRTVLLTLFAATALALACLGIYGTLSYVVNLRRREVGLRVALGALSGDIVSQFLKKALRVVGVACAAGLVLSLMFTRALSGMLYGVSPSDPATLSAVVAIVVVVAAVAALLPAMRAARIDPMEALRED